MAEEQQTILQINVDTSRAVTAIQEYNEQLAVVNEQIGEATEKYGKNSKEVITLTAKQKLLTDQIRRMNTEVKNEIQQGTAKKDSIVSLRAEYNKLKQKYVEMSAEERKASGAETLARMKALYGQISELEQSYGVFSRNVGNYNGKIVKGFEDVANAAGTMGGRTEPLIQGITNGIKGLDGAIKLLYANPIIALIGGLVVVIMAIANAISKNEELVNRLRVAMGPLNMVMDAFANVLDYLAEKLVSVVAAILDFIGATNGAEQAVKDYNAQIKEEISLEQERRKQVVSNAKGELEVSKMRDQLAKTNKKDFKSRKEQLKAIIDLEDGLAKKDVELAEREFELAKAKAQRAANDKEANEALAQAEAKVYKAQTSYFNKTREMAAQLTEIDQQQKEAEIAKTKAAQEAAKKRAEAKQKELEAIKKAQEEAAKLRQKELDEEKAAEQKRFKEELDAQKAENDSALAELDRQQRLRIVKMKQDGATQEQIEAEQAKMRMERLNLESLQIQSAYDELAQGRFESEADFQARKAELEARMANNDVATEEERVTQLLAERKKLADQSLEIEKAHTEAKTALQNGYNALMQTSLGKSKAAVATQKVLAVAQVAMNAGKAISEAVASASGGDPYTIALRIAAAVASVTAAVAKAKDAVSSATFATGGYVSGAGTSTSDSIHARLSNGESVMNARSTAMYGPLLSALNQSGGGAPINAVNAGNGANNSNFLAQQFAVALRQIPNPVVSVTEFTDVSNRVQSIESAASF